MKHNIYYTLLLVHILIAQVAYILRMLFLYSYYSPVHSIKPFDKGVDKQGLHRLINNEINHLEENCLRKIFSEADNPYKPLGTLVTIAFQDTKATPLSNGLFIQYRWHNAKWQIHSGFQYIETA